MSNKIYKHFDDINEEVVKAIDKIEQILKNERYPWTLISKQIDKLKGKPYSYVYEQIILQQENVPEKIIDKILYSSPTQTTMMTLLKNPDITHRYSGILFALNSISDSYIADELDNQIKGKGKPFAPAVIDKMLIEKPDAYNGLQFTLCRNEDLVARLANDRTITDIARSNIVNNPYITPFTKEIAFRNGISFADIDVRNLTPKMIEEVYGVAVETILTVENGFDDETIDAVKQSTKIINDLIDNKLLSQMQQYKLYHSLTTNHSIAAQKAAEFRKLIKKIITSSNSILIHRECTNILLTQNKNVSTTRVLEVINNEINDIGNYIKTYSKSEVLRKCNYIAKAYKFNIDRLSIEEKSELRTMLIDFCKSYKDQTEGVEIILKKMACDTRIPKTDIDKIRNIVGRELNNSILAQCDINLMLRPFIESNELTRTKVERMFDIYKDAYEGYLYLPLNFLNYKIIPELQKISEKYTTDDGKHTGDYQTNRLIRRLQKISLYDKVYNDFDYFFSDVADDDSAEPHYKLNADRFIKYLTTKDSIANLKKLTNDDLSIIAHHLKSKGTYEDIADMYKKISKIAPIYNKIVNWIKEKQKEESVRESIIAEER